LFAQVTATFQHASDSTKGLSQSYRSYYNTQFSAVEIRLDCGVLQYILEAKHHQQLAYIGH